jgi:membrane protease YdiL (CAAX protease family)
MRAPAGERATGGRSRGGSSGGQGLKLGVAPKKDPLQIAIRVGVYIALYFGTVLVFSPLWLWLGGYLTGVTATGLMAAVFANWLALKIFHNRGLMEIGLWLNRASGENLLMGLAGGAGAVALVLAPPLLAGAAHIAATPDDLASVGTVLFVTLLMACGAAGEELFFRGYGFQVLLGALGPFATVVPVGVLFGLLHGSNPSANWISTVNTAGFGILFGYAYLRSRDLWLPIGLHFSWNFTLTLFGVNVSGLRMKVTSYEMLWSAGNLWSGGSYGPEASVLTSAVLLLLFLYLRKIPARRQVSPLTEPSRESEVCEPSPPPPLLPS